MDSVVAFRLEPEFLERIEKFGKENDMGRSTIARKLMKIGYSEPMKEKAAEDYKSGKITLSLAASRAGLSIIDMGGYLVRGRFTSPYPIEDLEEEMKLLDSFRKKRA